MVWLVLILLTTFFRCASISRPCPAEQHCSDSILSRYSRLSSSSIDFSKVWQREKTKKIATMKRETWQSRWKWGWWFFSLSQFDFHRFKNLPRLRPNYSQVEWHGRRELLQWFADVENGKDDVAVEASRKDSFAVVAKIKDSCAVVVNSVVDSFAVVRNGT